MKKILYICAALLAISCVNEPQVAPVTGKVPVTVELAATKTVIAGNQISFAGAESMSLVCQGVNAAKITNKDVAVNKFSGEFTAVGQTKADATFYAVTSNPATPADRKRHNRPVPHTDKPSSSPWPKGHKPQAA